MASSANKLREPKAAAPRPRTRVRKESRRERVGEVFIKQKELGNGYESSLSRENKSERIDTHAMCLRWLASRRKEVRDKRQKNLLES